MEIAEIKRILQEQEKGIILGRERIIGREVNAVRLNKFLKYPNILAILGIRRSGKSVLSWLLMGSKRYGYVNFDDEAFYGMRAEDLNVVLKAFYELYGNLDYLILDEIQNAPGWELFANRLRRTKRVIITDSNSQLLSGELATHLTGRHIDFTLFPFSFKEFCAYRKITLALDYTTETAARMENALMEYVDKGGIPESYKYGKPILKSVFGDIIAKDIVRRYKIRNMEAIESLGKYLVSNFSSEISFNKLKNLFSVKKVQTIKNYVSYFENAYLVFILERFSYKLKQQAIAPKKIYCIDTGFINAVSFSSSSNLGRLFENVVCTELFRRKGYFESGHEQEIFYWKNAQQEEVDFVVKEGVRVRQLIQVCYSLDNPGTKKREINSLLKASRELKCSNLLVITYAKDGEERIKGKKIRYVSLWKWLLALLTFDLRFSSTVSQNNNKP